MSLEQEQYEEMEGCYSCFDETHRAWTRPIKIEPEMRCLEHLGLMYRALVRKV